MELFEEAKQKWESRDDWPLADRDAERRFFYQSGEEGLRAELAAEREKVSALEIKVNNQQDWLVEWRKCEEALKAERKKREEAVSDLEVLQTAYNNAETIVRRLVSRAEQSEQERDTAESAVSDLMNQIKVLQESLVKISNAEFAPEAGPKIHNDRQLWLRCRMEDEARDTLANLPVRAAAVEKVLEAAEEYVVSCQEEAMGPRFLEETNLFEAVRERREG